jgi:hypothetical protein
VCRGNSTVGSNPTLSAIESAKVPLAENQSAKIAKLAENSGKWPKNRTAENR